MIENPTDASLLGVNGFRIDGRRHFSDLSESPKDHDEHEPSLNLLGPATVCQIRNQQSPITRMECGVGPYVKMLESGLGMVA